MRAPSIFIVEDEAIVAADLASKLRQLGYRVAGEVGNGEDALQLVGQLQPDLVLLDIRLSGAMDGIAVAEVIRREYDLPVVFLTAHSDAATLERAKLAKPAGYLIKPFVERELLTTLEMALYKHQADRQVREQREWFRITLASIGDAVIACDTESRITFLNPVAERLAGWTAKEVIGQPIQRVLRLVHQQTRQPVDDPVAHVLREGKPITPADETLLITGGGREVPTENNAAPILDGTGRVIGAVVVFQDVSERRQAADALRRSQEDLNHAQAVAHIGSWRLDVQRNELLWSDETHRIFGIPKGTLLTYEAFLATVHPEDREMVDRSWRAALRGEPYDIEHRILVGEQVKWVRERAELEFDPTGSLRGGFGTAQDITVRKQIEAVHAFLAQCGYQPPGEGFFNALARYLAPALGMDYVCIDRLDGDGLVAQTVAVYSDGWFQDNLVYALKDTPCGVVVGKSVCCFPENVRHLFPRDEVLQRLAAESYVGTTLWSYDAKPIGLIALIGRKPLRDPRLAQSVLRAVADRAAGELERLQAEEALRLALKESQQRGAEVTALLTGARSVLEHTRFLPAARAIYEVCKELIGGRAGYVALLRGASQEYDLLFLDSGDADCAVDPSLPMPVRGLRAEAHRTRRAVYENVFPASDHAALLPEGHMGLQNVLFAPLLLEGKPVGLLGLANKPGGFTENDARLASAFAELAAVALQNSRNLELLGDSEERFRLVAHSAVDAIMTADANGHIVFWNQAAEHVFGYAAEEILGQPLLRLVPNRLQTAHQQAFVRALSQESLQLERRTRETIGLRKDATEVPIELSTAMWRRGQAMFCTAIIRDIRERKQSEAALQRAHDDLEARVEQRTRDLAEAVSRLESEVATRARVEAELRETEERYRTLFSAAPVGISVTDASGRVHDANAVMCAMFGITLAEAQAYNARSFYVNPADRRRLMSRVRRETRVEDFEAVLRRKDGTQFSASINLNWIHLGQQELFLTLVTDLTRRRQAERHIQGVAALQELFLTRLTRGEYLEAVVKFLRDWANCACAGIRLVNHNGQLPFVASAGFSREFRNEEGRFSVDTSPCPCLPATRKRTGQIEEPFARVRSTILRNDLSELLDQSTGQRAEWAEMPCVKARYASVAHAPIYYGNRFLGMIQLADRRDGKFPLETAQFLDTAAALVGEALHRFGLEAELRESEERFRLLFQHHQAVMLLVDPESGAIVDANEAAERFYGFPPGRLTNLSVHDLHVQRPPPARSRATGSVQGMDQRAVFPQRLANGEIRTVEIHSSPIVVRERTLLFAIIQDITERRRLERQVLDIADRERQRVGRDLHDSLGGALSGLAMLSKALAQALARKSIPEATIAQEIVQGINEAVGRTRAIAHGLCPVGLSAFGFANGLEELARNVEKRHGVRCQVRVPHDEVISDDFVASHLFQIVEEAVNNAVRHGRTRKIAIAIEREPGGFLLRVQDDGVGLPADADRSSGMGLRTMRYRAGVIGATLELGSPPTGGTIVSCHVPVAAPTNTTTSTPS